MKPKFPQAAEELLDVIILDEVWMVVSPEHGVLYGKPGLTPAEAWRNALRASRITGGRAYWKQKGFAAKKVRIVL